MIGLAAASLAFAACDREAEHPATSTRCSEAFYRAIDERVPTGDGQGHGPDVGSDEWKSVVEFQLGVRGDPDVPERDSDDWCRHIDQLMHSVGEPPGSSAADSAPGAARPSFACEDAAPSSIEAMICGDEVSSALDRQLAEVYAAAAEKATHEHPPVLAAEQRGWIKGRNECWKDADPHGCVRGEYARRIAELQASYRLVPFEGPVRYACDGDSTNEVVATFFQTDPPTLVAERGDSVSLMFLQRSASGARYQGRNESFWEHQGEATITWGTDAPEMRCERVPGDQSVLRGRSPEHA